jgi:glycosyltransferase involved in cell wall biosynthesis
MSRLQGVRLLYDLEPNAPITFGIIEPIAVQRTSPRENLDVSVVIRSKNEAVWLRRSLSALLNQYRPPKDVIVVDNDSTDETVKVASDFGCRVLTIPDGEFSFGRALNRGIDAATTPWVVSLSAHCIPVHDQWLEVFAIERARADHVAAVYGRQEPLPDTSDFDKRDLWTTFGAEKRIQRGQDHFFHNANSMIAKAVWERIKFDEELSGVEDRDWAKKVLAEGHQIVYTPLASVYHYHGIHQGRDERRAQRVARVIELIHERPHVPTAASVSSLEG